MSNPLFPQQPDISGTEAKLLKSLTVRKTTPFEDREREQSIVQLGQAVPLVFGVYRPPSVAPAGGPVDKPVLPNGSGGVWTAPPLFKAAHKKSAPEEGRFAFIISEGDVRNIRDTDVYFGTTQLFETASLTGVDWDYAYERIPDVFTSGDIVDGYYITRTKTDAFTLTTNDRRTNVITGTRNINNPQELDDSSFTIIESLGNNIRYTRFVLENTVASGTIDGEYSSMNGMRIVPYIYPYTINLRGIDTKTLQFLLGNIGRTYDLAMRSKFRKIWQDSVTFDVYYRRIPRNTSTEAKKSIPWTFHTTVSLAEKERKTVEISHTVAGQWEYLINPIPVRYTGRSLLNLSYRPTSCYSVVDALKDEPYFVKKGVWFEYDPYPLQSGNWRQFPETDNELAHVNRIARVNRAYRRGTRYAVVYDPGNSQKCYEPFTQSEERPKRPDRTAYTNTPYSGDGGWSWKDETVIREFYQRDFVDVYIVNPLEPGRPGLPGTKFTVPQSRLYDDITIGAYAAIITNPPKDYLNQLFIFCRSGLRVKRVLNNYTYGASDNFADLVYYLLQKSANLSDGLIDRASLKRAAKFTNRMGMYFNGALTTTTSLREFINTVAPYFLTRLVLNDGKAGLAPLLPLTDDFNPKTTKLTPEFTVTAADIIPDSYTKNYTPKTQQEPFHAVMTWRKQTPTKISSITTTLVRYKGTPETAVHEEYDMTLFCTTEFHAIYIARYLLAYRKYVSHTLTFTGTQFFANKKPGAFFAVKLQLISGTAEKPQTTTDIEYYLLDSLTENIDGTIEVNATHFPLDTQGRSIITREMLTGEVEVMS